MKIQGRTRALPMVRDMAKCDNMENSLYTLENKAPFHMEPPKSTYLQSFRPSVILLFLGLIQIYPIIQASKQ